jgi:hypothetical protein
MCRLNPGGVAEIQAAGARDSKKQDQQRLRADSLASQLKSEKKLTKALVCVCAELAGPPRSETQDRGTHLGEHRCRSGDIWCSRSGHFEKRVLGTTVVMCHASQPFAIDHDDA